MSIRSRASTALLAAAGVGVALTLSGCSYNTLETYDLENELGPAHDLRYDPSPEAYTLHQRPSDMRNEFGVMWDENTRMIRQDWHRMMYWNRPSRLTREPVPR
ncbi:MAG: hypothetical protein KDA05_10480 [Phycisphaerales bacterium]|nr:hypothetical protein [Phycisphaerales bacterium]MCB9841401.1 hypothetical protein [Phycisphaeraceae bacterium]